MTKQNVNTTEAIADDMGAIIKFTYYCNNQLQQVSRGLTEHNQAIYSVLGYKQGVEDTKGYDILGYVYQQFSRAMLGTPDQQKEAFRYFRDNSHAYREHSIIK